MTDALFPAGKSPRELGYTFPAEWSEQTCVYLSWPSNPQTWEDCFDAMESAYADFAAAISRHELLRIVAAVSRVPAPLVSSAPPSHTNGTAKRRHLVINGAVLFPTYRQDASAEAAMKILAQAFPGREIIPVDCYDIILEGGALHCLSQQQPK